LDADTGKPAEKKINPPTLGGFRQIQAVSSDGWYVVAHTDFQADMFIWDIEKGAKLRSIGSGFVEDYGAFTRDRRRLVSVDRSIQVWDLLGDKKPLGAHVEDGPVEHIRGLTWSPDGAMLLARAGYCGVQYLWDTRTGRLR